jgi:hypothetical protein
MARLQAQELDQEDDPDLSGEWLEPQERSVREQEQHSQAVRNT